MLRRPALADEVGSLRQSVVGAPVEQRDVRAALRQAHGDALANAAACAGHQSHVAGEVEQRRRIECDVGHRSAFLLRWSPVP